MKTALITGITGQDGSYLAELLLEKGYMVHGIQRRTSTPNVDNIKHLIGHERLCLHFGEMTDGANLMSIIKQTRPDEIYNLAAQSHVRISFDTPVDTGNINALGVTRILEAMRTLNMFETTKFYQASTSELYGKIQEPRQDEETPFYPRSPYGIAKLYAFWMLKNYRESYNAFACNGILFNHESPRRGENFVTRKVTKKVAAIAKGEREKIEFGNIDAQRDWGHAKDYVHGMWLMLQQDKPDDYVLATGEVHSVREFIEIAFNHIGMPITWEGSGVDEVGLDADGNVRVSINPKYYRPTEVELLYGDPSKAERELGWTREYNFTKLVTEMLESDING